MPSRQHAAVEHLGVLDAAKKRDLDATVHALRMVERLSPERVDGLAMADDVRKLVMQEGSDELHGVLLGVVPGHSWVIGDVADDLNKGKDLRARHWYTHALAANPDDTDNLGNYAIFLADVRKDHDAAEEHYRRALTSEPNNADALGNYAKLVLTQVRIDEAKDLLKRAWLSNPAPILRLELLFYEWAFHLDPSAWKRLTRLLTDGTRSPGWPLAACAEAAIAHGHPEPDLVRAIARVISEEAPIDTLDAFPTWASRPT